MTKADLISIEPVPKEDGTPIMEIKFAKVARWTPKTLLQKQIEVTEWLQFLEDCFQQFKDENHTIKPGFLSVEHAKTQVNLIGEGTHSFSIPKNKWKRFVEEQAEKLLLNGIISVGEVKSDN